MIHSQREDNFLVRVGATKIMKIWLCMFIDRRQFLPFFQAQKKINLKLKEGQLPDTMESFLASGGRSSWPPRTPEKYGGFKPLFTTYHTIPPSYKTTIILILKPAEQKYPTNNYVEEEPAFYKILITWQCWYMTPSRAPLNKHLGKAIWVNGFKDRLFIYYTRHNFSHYCLK